MPLRTVGRALLDRVDDEILFEVENVGHLYAALSDIAPLTSGRSAAPAPLRDPARTGQRGWIYRSKPGRALTFSLDGRAYIVPIRALVRVIHREQAEVEISTPIDDARDLDDAASRQQTLGAWA